MTSVFPSPPPTLGGILLWSPILRCSSFLSSFSLCLLLFCTLGLKEEVASPVRWFFELMFWYFVYIQVLDFPSCSGFHSFFFFKHAFVSESQFPNEIFLGTAIYTNKSDDRRQVFHKYKDIVLTPRWGLKWLHNIYAVFSWSSMFAFFTVLCFWNWDASYNWCQRKLVSHQAQEQIVVWKLSNILKVYIPVTSIELLALVARHGVDC